MVTMVWSLKRGRAVNEAIPELGSWHLDTGAGNGEQRKSGYARCQNWKITEMRLLGWRSFRMGRLRPRSDSMPGEELSVSC